MSKDDNVIDIQAELVIKKSPDCRQVAHKAKAGLSEAEAIERHTVGRFGDDDEEESDGES